MDFEAINFLEEKINVPNTERITTSEEIYEYINEITCYYSRETARKRLERFRKGIYYASWGHTNPFFIQKAQQDLAGQNSSFTDELFYLHRLMYNYLRNESHSYLVISSSDRNLTSYSETQFKWNIPIRFMPIFLSYILATDSIMSSKKAFSFKVFFLTLEDYLSNTILSFRNKYNDFDKYEVKDLFIYWLNHYLGRQYFLALDSICEDYSQTQEQRKILQNCFSPITYSLLNCSVCPRLAPIFSHILLHRCKEYLDSKRKEHDLAATDLSLFYPHEDEWEINDEKKFISDTAADITKLWDDSLCFINNYLQKNSKPTPYKIAVKNFEEFHSEYLNCINEMKTYISEEILSEKLFSFFYETCHNPDIENAILAHSITFDKRKAKLHIDKFAFIIDKHNNVIMKEFDLFSRMVKYASAPKPETYKTLKINEDYLDNLTKAIDEEKEMLSSEISKALKELPCIIKFHNSGYIQELQSRLSLFSEEDLAPLDNFLHSYDQKRL